MEWRDDDLLKTEARSLLNWWAVRPLKGSTVAFLRLLLPLSGTSSAGSALITMYC